ncbi:MBL fold metallo-hydrolase [Tessaracoccus aquimaris]|uniref:MBL fold metallo-hydrolase n=1 Tax=Tessaracoccus aquimaris TaxID=1332264 RepID=UPI001314FC4B|nr:MBL fold metallo-hydrolase [Tessaracoccus aquimaris]
MSSPRRAAGTLDYFACGSTSHDLALLFRGALAETRTFPAGAFLYQSPSGAVVLFDTGYAPDTAAAGLPGRLYSRLLPPTVGPGDTIDARLRAAGLSPDDVTHVVLSHAHPDHIGGVRHFPAATFVMSAGIAETLASPRLKEGVLRALLPDWFASAKRTVLTAADLSPTTVRGLDLSAHDLLGDGTYLLTPLPGHARGHLGAVVEERVLLAGDAAWGSDLIERTASLRPLPGFIQHDRRAYQATALGLREAEAAGLRICLSHDRYDGARLLP